MTALFLLASFPKSGNTWLRIFLENLLNDSDNPININKLSIPSASSRNMFDTISGISSEDLLPNEIDFIRRQVFKSYANAKNDVAFLKTHETLHCKRNEHDSFTAEAISGAVYLVRNPLDIAVSLAQHNNVCIDRAIEQMNDEHMVVADDDDYPDAQFPQCYGCWSQHIASWLNVRCFPVLVITYESLIEDAFLQFSRIASFLGVKKTEVVIRRSIQFSDFRHLQKQERECGFRECHHDQQQFFRNGKSSEWNKMLSQKQHDKIISQHYQFMKKFGYV